MKIALKMLGGSHSYGLNTPQSDIDYRGVYYLDNTNDIIGLNSNGNHQSVTINKEKDEVYVELRQFFRLLQKGGTNALEMLWSRDAIEVDFLFKHIREQAIEFTDSDTIYKSFSGYSHNEFRLATGERTGLLGGKRKEALDKFGFSPKNAANLIRILWSGQHFFCTGKYPVRVSEVYPELAEYLLKLKISPECFTKEQICKKYEELKNDFEMAYMGGLFGCSARHFNRDLANEFILKAYRSFLD